MSNSTSLKILRNGLEKALTPLYLSVVDESNAHQGHLAHIPDTLTHVNIKVVSDQFHGLGLVQRHKLVYSIVNKSLPEDEGLDGTLHAISLETLAPEESDVVEE